MAVHPSFSDLLQRLREGDNDAAWDIYKRYAQRLIGLAKVHINNKKVRQKLDAEDVVQSVFKSFFVRLRDGQFDLENWDSVAALLTAITLNKCKHKARDLYRQWCDIRLEVSPVVGRDQSEGIMWRALAKDPTPSEAAILAETLQGLLSGLKERPRRIVELYLEGTSLNVIMVEVKRTKYTVMDVIRGFHHQLKSLLLEST